MPQIIQERNHLAPRTRRLVLLFVTLVIMSVALISLQVALTLQRDAAQDKAAMTRARTLDSTGKYSQEQASLLGYLATRPLEPFACDALHQLGAVDINLGQPQEAIASYTQAQPLCQLQLADVVALAGAYLETGNASQATNYYARAIIMAQTRPHGRYYSQIPLYRQELKLLRDHN